MSRKQSHLIVLALSCLLSAGRVASAERDPKAEEIAHAMMRAMGGEDAWALAHVVRFDFRVTAKGKVVANNLHLWDRKDGRYRLERMLKNGKREVVLFNIGDYQAHKAGSAYVNGKKVEGEAGRKAVDEAYASYINDMWWLAMPWKWLDPGVNLKYQGSRNRNQESDDVVQLTFGHVGLTPGDMYHAFVSRQSRLMTHWEYVLQSGDKGSWDWQYADIGFSNNKVKLARNHTSSDGKTTINMGKVRILEQADDAFFTDPSHLLSKLN